jgi:hypothetical protein
LSVAMRKWRCRRICPEPDSPFSAIEAHVLARRSAEREGGRS